MSYGPHTHNPIEHSEQPEDDPRFACACGEADCWGFNDDPQNIRIGKSWYAADCTHKPLAITEDQDRAFRADVARDDMNERRR